MPSYMRSMPNRRPHRPRRRCAADTVSQAMVDIEDRIAALLPTSPAGAAAQLQLLRQWGRDFEWNEPLEELADKLLAGLERIGEAQL